MMLLRVISNAKNPRFRSDSPIAWNSSARLNVLAQSSLPRRSTMLHCALLGTDALMPWCIPSRSTLPLPWHMGFAALLLPTNSSFQSWPTGQHRQLVVCIQSYRKHPMWMSSAATRWMKFLAIWTITLPLHALAWLHFWPWWPWCYLLVASVV